MAFKIAKTPLKGPKKILCLKEPEQMQKTRDDSDHSGPRKLQKTAKKVQN